MIVFLKWLKTDSPIFENRYLEVTGERIESPLEDASGTYFLIGSSRLVPTHLDILQQEFSIETSTEFPDNWEYPIELEE